MLPPLPFLIKWLGGLESDARHGLQKECDIRLTTERCCLASSVSISAHLGAAIDRVSFCSRCHRAETESHREPSEPPAYREIRASVPDFSQGNTEQLRVPGSGILGRKRTHMVWVFFCSLNSGFLPVQLKGFPASVQALGGIQISYQTTDLLVKS